MARRLQQGFSETSKSVGFLVFIGEGPWF